MTVPRWERRILLVLLTDADELSIWPIARTARVRCSKVSALLDQLEDICAVRSELGTPSRPGGPRSRFYRLTPSGRRWAYERVGLKPPSGNSHDEGTP